MGAPPAGQAVDRLREKHQVGEDLAEQVKIVEAAGYDAEPGHPAGPGGHMTAPAAAHDPVEIMLGHGRPGPG
nr:MULTISPECIES: hypothetical protein [Frankia]